jgi:hypothetical protein
MSSQLSKGASVPLASQSVAAGPCVVAIDGFDAAQEHPGSRGSAIVLGPHHLLTCWHVVQHSEGDPWGKRSRLADHPWARLSLAHSPSAAPLECVGYDTALDIALLYSPTELRAPVARWLDVPSVQGWLKKSSPWVALGYPENTRRLSRHSGTGWLSENRDYLQLQGGIPAGFSGGALMPEHAELCAGLIQSGGKKSPTSVALSIEMIERFLWSFKGRDAIELIRVPAPRLVLERPEGGLRGRSAGSVLAVAGVIVLMLGALAMVWGMQRSRENETPVPLAPAPVQQTTNNTISTTGDGSPVIVNPTAPVNLKITPDGKTVSE